MGMIASGAGMSDKFVSREQAMEWATAVALASGWEDED